MVRLVWRTVFPLKSGRDFAKRLLAVIAASILVAGMLAACSARKEPGGALCPVTFPNGSTPPGAAPADQYHGNGALWTVLWPEGIIPISEDGPGEIRADGSLAMKFPWWRGEGVRGELEIDGRRLDDKADPAYGEIPGGYGETGFQASAIVFSSPGCWEITGRVGDAALTFIQRVEVRD